MMKKQAMQDSHPPRKRHAIHWLMICCMLLTSCSTRPDYEYTAPSQYGEGTEYGAQEEDVETEWRINWSKMGPLIAAAGLVIAGIVLVESFRDTPDKLTNN